MDTMENVFSSFSNHFLINDNGGFQTLNCCHSFGIQPMWLKNFAWP